MPLTLGLSGVSRDSIFIDDDGNPINFGGASAKCDNGVGNSLANTLTGNGGNNTLTGLDSKDTLSGGLGDDTLNGGDQDDVLLGGAGNDTLNGQDNIDTASYAGATGAVTVALIPGAQNTGGAEIDTLLNVENLTGSAFGDTLTGNGGANLLVGANGVDTLVGGGGADALLGDAGEDTLVGGLGQDELTGGASDDKFDYNNINESGTSAATRDRILDFVQGSDKIDLATIDANTLVAGNQAFIFIAAAAFSGVAGELRATTGASITLIQGDVNGDEVADFHIELDGIYTVTGSNFVK